MGSRSSGPVEGRNGSICSLVSADGGRSMAADRGTRARAPREDVDASWLKGCDHLHVSGYALMVEPVRSAALRATALARAEGARISVDLASWSAIRDSGVEAFREVVRTVDPDVVFANEEEESVVGRSVGRSAWILKRGAGGCSFDGDEREALPVEQVVDSTRRGRRPRWGWIVGGPDLALSAAAARCVQAGRRDAVRFTRVSDPIQLSDEVRAALEDGTPVVALETTLVAHGFPRPPAWEVGLRAIAQCALAGAVPATTGVLDGRIRVGLTEEELARFTPDARKVGPVTWQPAPSRATSARPPWAGSSQSRGASASASSARGGIGGVHRGYPNPPDVSADIVALVQSPRARDVLRREVLLDIPATTEYLETLGIPCLGYGTDTLPLFYSAAGTARPATGGRRQGGSSNGGRALAARRLWLLPANPPPESIEVEGLIEEAVEAAARAGASGQALTPFVLAYLHEHSDGRTREVNRKLIVANARLAAEVSVAFAAL